MEFFIEKFTVIGRSTMKFKCVEEFLKRVEEEFLG